VSRLLAGHVLGTGIAAAVVSLSALILPAQSSAAVVELRAPASNGYWIQVKGKGSSGKVTLSAEGPSGIAVYEVPGRVTPRGISANFGRLGMVDVTFRRGGRMTIDAREGLGPSAGVLSAEPFAFVASGASLVFARGGQPAAFASTPAGGVGGHTEERRRHPPSGESPGSRRTTIRSAWTSLIGDTALRRGRSHLAGGARSP